MYMLYLSSLWYGCSFVYLALVLQALMKALAENPNTSLKEFRLANQVCTCVDLEYINFSRHYFNKKYIYM